MDAKNEISQKEAQNASFISGLKFQTFEGVGILKNKIVYLQEQFSTFFLSFFEFQVVP